MPDYHRMEQKAREALYKKDIEIKWKGVRIRHSVSKNVDLLREMAIELPRKYAH